MNVSVHSRIIHEPHRYASNMEVEVRPNVRIRSNLAISSEATKDKRTHPSFVREATKKALTEFFEIHRTEHLVDRLERMLYNSEVNNQFDMITLMHSINPILDDLRKVNQSKLDFNIDNPAQAFNPYIMRYQ